MNGTVPPLVLMCWEYGHGLGHIGLLRHLALRLKDAGFRILIVNPASAIFDLKPPFDEEFRLEAAGPSRVRRGVDRAPIVSFNSAIEGFGYFDVRFLLRRLQLWRDLLEERSPALVVGDYAPSALMVARNMGIPTVALGNGYTLPPADMDRFHPFSYQNQFSENIQVEAMLASVNVARKMSGIEPVRSLPEIFSADIAGCMTFDFCDPFAKWRRTPVLGPVFDRPLRPTHGQAPRAVFCYLSHCRREIHSLSLKSLADLDVPVTVYSLQVDAEERRLYRGSNIEFLDHPIPIEDIQANYQLVTHLGGHLLCLEMIICGKPQVILTGDIEKLLLGRLLKKKGLVDYARVDASRDPHEITTTLRAALDNQALNKRVLEFAGSLPSDIHRRGMDKLMNKISILMDL